MDIVNYLGEGKSNAKTRLQLSIETGMCDRQVRKALEEAKQEVVIINNGEGYYIPTPDDKYELFAYIKKEDAKARSIMTSIKLARKLMNDFETKRIV